MRIESSIGFFRSGLPMVCGRHLTSARAWLGGCVSANELPISNALKQRLAAWHEFFEAQISENQFNVDSKSEFDAQGLNVVIDISKELGKTFLVEYEIGGTHLLFENGKCVAVVEQEKIKL